MIDNRFYERRRSGHLAVIVTALFMLPAFFIVTSAGELVDALYFEEIRVHSLELPVWPGLIGFAVSFGIFGAVSMRCLNPDYGKVTRKKILVLLLALLLCAGILLGGVTVGTNMAECYTEDGLMAVNQREILVYTWDDVAESRFESDDEDLVLRFIMTDDQEYVYGAENGFGADSDGFCAKFPDGKLSYMKFVYDKLASAGKVDLSNGRNVAADLYLDEDKAFINKILQSQER